MDLDVEMPDVVGPGESMAGPNTVAAPPATDRPTFPRPPGPAPKVGGVELPWDREDGCWRRPDGSVHVVGHNEKAKAETAKAKAEEERLSRVREELAREEREVAAYRAKSIEEWGKVMDRVWARTPELMAAREKLHARKRAMMYGGSYIDD